MSKRKVWPRPNIHWRDPNAWSIFRGSAIATGGFGTRGEALTFLRAQIGALQRDGEPINKHYSIRRLSGW